MNHKRILVKEIKAATRHLSWSTTENHDKSTTAEWELWGGTESRIAGMQVKNTITWAINIVLKNFI